MIVHFNIYLLVTCNDPTSLLFMPPGGQYDCTEGIAGVLVFYILHYVCNRGIVPGARTST